jgi:SHS2 domain-containing protein
MPQSPSFWIIEHSGDLRIRSEGADFLEALAHASLGLLSQMVPSDTITEREERPISVTGDTPAEQAIAFLNELIYLAYGRHWIAKRVKLLTVCNRKGCKELEGVLVGEPVDSSRHEFRYDVKAVTYHDFKLEQESSKTIIEFVCDL